MSRPDRPNFSQEEKNFLTDEASSRQKIAREEEKSRRILEQIKPMPEFIPEDLMPEEPEYAPPNLMSLPYNLENYQRRIIENDERNELEKIDLEHTTALIFDCLNIADNTLKLIAGADKEPSTSQSSADLLVRKFNHLLTRYGVEGMEQIIKQAMKSALAKAQKAEPFSLNIQISPNLQCNFLPIAISEFTGLNKLEIVGNQHLPFLQTSAKDVAVIGCPNLKSLIANKAKVVAVSFCPNLASCHLKQATTVFFGSCDNLNKFAATAENGDLIHLDNCRNLKSVSASNFNKFRAYRCPNLVTLDLTSAHFIDVNECNTKPVVSVGRQGLLSIPTYSHTFYNGVIVNVLGDQDYLDRKRISHILVRDTEEDNFTAKFMEEKRMKTLSETLPSPTTRVSSSANAAAAAAGPESSPTHHRA